MAHVFISYKRGDRAFSTELKQRLINDGFEVWIDEDLSGGKKWLDEIESKIRDSFAVVIVVTPEAVESEWVNYEWIFARGANIEIIPIHFKTVEKFPCRLDDYQLIDFRTVYDWKKLSKRLRDIKSEHTNKTKDTPQNHPPFIIQVLDKVESLDQNERKDAIQKLKLSDHPAAIKTIEQLLDHHLIDVRANSAIIYSERTNFSDQRSLKPLLDSFKTNDKQLQQACAIVLQKFGALAVENLIELLKSQQDYVRQVVAWSLGEIKDQRATTHLIQLLSDNNFSVVIASVKALGNIRSDDAIPALASILTKQSKINMKGLSDILGKTIGDWVEKIDNWNYKNLCEAAIESLNQIGTPEALAAVEAWKQEQAGK